MEQTQQAFVEGNHSDVNFRVSQQKCITPVALWDTTRFGSSFWPPSGRFEIDCPTTDVVNDCPYHAMLLFAEVYTKRHISRRCWCVTHHASSACWTMACYSESHTQETWHRRGLAPCKTTTGSRLIQYCYKRVSCRNLQMQSKGVERCKIKWGKSKRVPIHHRFMQHRQQFVPNLFKLQTPPPVPGQIL